MKKLKPVRRDLARALDTHPSPIPVSRGLWTDKNGALYCLSWSLTFRRDWTEGLIKRYAGCDGHVLDNIFGGTVMFRVAIVSLERIAHLEETQPLKHELRAAREKRAALRTIFAARRNAIPNPAFGL